MQARDLHAKAAEAESQADLLRQRRDRLVRDLYATGSWSYGRLAAEVRCSRELIAHIVKRRDDDAPV